MTIAAGVKYDPEAVRAALDACKAASEAIHAVVMARPEPARARKPPGRPRVVKGGDRVRFDQALHRVVRGDLNIGDACAQLSALTGVPYFDIRKRVNDVEYTYSDEEKSGNQDNQLSSGDLKTLIGRYNRSQDPEVRAWIASIRAKPSPTDR